MKAILNKLIGILFILIINLIVIGLYYIPFITIAYNNPSFNIIIDEESSININPSIKEEVIIIDNTDKISSQIIKIDEYAKEYDIAIKYYNFQNNYEYNYNRDKSYYSASTFKLLDALYIYNNNINMEDTIKFNTSILKEDHSIDINNYKKNDLISIKLLLKQSIAYSNNVAHFNLCNYLDINNMINYNKTLSTKYNIRSSDYYGYINTDDALIYLNEINYILKKDSYLRELMNNNLYNNLNIPQMKFYHKYGSYKELYHDIGISISDKPYALIILSHERNNATIIFNNISTMIYQLNELINEDTSI